jgi:tripartite-type tricarboxylate transporter receptor subunit TctC
VADIPFIVPFGRDGAADRAAWAYSDRFAHPATSPRAALLRAAHARKSGTGNLPLAPHGASEPNLVIENHPGSGGLLGVQRASAAARGGGPVLLLATPSTHILLPARAGTMAVLDLAFRPLIELGSGPHVLLVSPHLGVTSAAGLLERARAERLIYASAGAGQTSHVCAAYLCALVGVSLSHRPYVEGSAAPYEDLKAGRVHAYFDNIIGCRDHVLHGEAIPLAISAANRIGELPEVPTLAECGFPEHALDVWHAVFGANIDGATMQRLGANEAAALALQHRIERSRPAWLRALETTPDLRA